MSEAAENVIYERLIDYLLAQTAEPKFGCPDYPAVAIYGHAGEPPRWVVCWNTFILGSMLGIAGGSRVNSAGKALVERSHGPIFIEAYPQLRSVGA